MAGIGLEFDPTSEDGANVPLNVNDGSKFRAMKFEAPMPERSVNWSSSADTEGEQPANLRYQNRKITAEWRVYGSSAANLMEELGKLEQKVGRVNTPSEQATLKWTGASGTSCIFDLLEAEVNTVIDNPALATNRAVVTASFVAKPFWRSGIEVEGALHEETTLPCVIGVDSAIGGDVPPLGRLVITEKQGVDQWSVTWGTQSRYYDSSEDAELFYQAESRTPIGSSEKKAGPTGASGTGENTIFQGSLIPSYQGIASTQKAGGGNHLRNVGSFRVFARVQRPTTNTGSVSVALSWAQGDSQLYTTNATKTYAADELEGVWTLVDLGLVRIAKVTAGTQRWEGRLLAKSTVAGDDIYVDCFGLFPVDEGYGTLKFEPSSATPTTLVAHDEFDQAGGGNLEGKTLSLGGVWSAAGKTGASGFLLNSTVHMAERTAVSDAGSTSGAFAIAGTSSYAGAVVQMEIGNSSGEHINLPTSGGAAIGIFARYVNAENWLLAVLQPFTGEKRLVIYKNVAGAILSIRNASAGTSFQVQGPMTLTVTAAGVVTVNYRNEVSATAQHADLATGGVLASGKVGMYDSWFSTVASTRRYDNFYVAGATTTDAAIFASRQAEIRWDRMQRQDSSGTLWVPRSDYKGSYFRPPPSRREARSLRTIVKLSRYNTDTMQDAAIDDAAFRIFWQARGLLLPES